MTSTADRSAMTRNELLERACISEERVEAFLAAGMPNMARIAEANARRFRELARKEG